MNKMKLDYFFFSLIFIVSNTVADDGLEIYKKMGIDFVDGGVTASELDQLSKVASRFPMRLHFKIKNRDLPIEGVDVKIYDTKSDLIFVHSSKGPHLFLGLDNGRYTVMATYSGEKQSMTRDLTGRRSLLLRFEFNP
tara:strand:- start:65 stop:475 length:411 start_codon:yes stop_codon:yes gene_type:complete